ncbi:MAG: I78 family peptidase inhibitor [Hyphomonadaceae bacterium]
MRAAVAALTLLAACAAQETPAPQAALDPLFNPDDFTVAGNACGASAFAHLVGEPFGEMHQTAMPADTRVIAHNMANTLEYTPDRLNVILDGRGRIAAIGCF